MPYEAEIAGLSNATNWIGLGNMEYCGKGFSNIRILDFKHASSFSEEVYIHEFLHTLERNSEEYGYEIPELHDSEKYGYNEDSSNGLKQWYMDYMNKQIKNDGEYIGLPEEVYSYKPAQSSNFEYSNKLDLLDDPKNIVEVVKSMVDRIKQLFDKDEEIIKIRSVAS